MKTLKLFCVFLASLSVLTGCDMIDYHPYDTRIKGRHNINAENIERIERQCAGQDTLRFALIGDTQREYDDTKDIVRTLNARHDLDFVIHVGDVSDFGATKEFEIERDIMEKLTMPYVVLIGNHDCIGTGPACFQYIFGDTDFSFNAGDTHFLCLNTNALEYDYATPIPNFDFIARNRETIPDSIRRTVVGMHAKPGTEQFPANVAGFFQSELHKYPGLQFCYCGHGHKVAVDDLFDDGIIYYQNAAIWVRNYMLFTLTKDGKYEYELVDF